MHNKERLDGLSSSYFSEMTPEERNMAFDYLLQKLKAGGSAETVNGLFIADQKRAMQTIEPMLSQPVLSDEARLSAAWNISRIKRDKSMLPIFIRYLGDPNVELRESAAHFVPASNPSAELIFALRGMIRTESEQLARIHAVDKLLACYGFSEESAGSANFSALFRELHSEDIVTKEAAFKKLEKFSPITRD